MKEETKEKLVGEGAGKEIKGIQKVYQKVKSGKEGKDHKIKNRK